MTAAATADAPASAAVWQTCARVLNPWVSPAKDGDTAIDRMTSALTQAGFCVVTDDEYTGAVKAGDVSWIVIVTVIEDIAARTSIAARDKLRLALAGKGFIVMASSPADTQRAPEGTEGRLFP